jgi:hypothetical protein
MGITDGLVDCLGWGEVWVEDPALGAAAETI